MTFKSKRTIASITTGVALSIGYILYALSSHAPAISDLRGWALTMLIFIGISIAVTIVIMILFHIGFSIGVAVKEQDKSDAEVERIIASDTEEDEMDKLVEMKATNAGYICVGIGFVAALCYLAFVNTSAVIALHIILASGCLGSFIEGIMSIFLYERGV